MADPKKPQQSPKPATPPKPPTPKPDEPKSTGPDTSTVTTVTVESLLALYREATGKADATLDAMLADTKAKLDVQAAKTREAKKKAEEFEKAKAAFAAAIKDLTPAVTEAIGVALEDIVASLREAKVTTVQVAILADKIEIMLLGGPSAPKATAAKSDKSGDTTARQKFLGADGEVVSSDTLAAAYPQFQPELDMARQAKDKNNAVARVRGKMIEHDLAQAKPLGKWV